MPFRQVAVGVNRRSSEPFEFGGDPVLRGCFRSSDFIPLALCRVDLVAI